MKLVFVLVGGSAGVLDLTAKRNVVVHWGKRSQRPLRDYCQEASVTTLVIASAVDLSVDPAGLAHLNVTGSSLFPWTSNDARQIKAIGSDIDHCQERGKTVLLNIRSNSSGILSRQGAYRLATDIWNMLLGGDTTDRPFGPAILDGINLAVGNASQANIPLLTQKLAVYFKRGDRRYFVTASPTCDQHTLEFQHLLEKTHLDAVFIRFFANWCGVQSYQHPRIWNWRSWEAWATTVAFNRDVKLFLGITATPASQDYLPPEKLRQIVYQLRLSPHFGGVALWGSAHADHGYRNHVASFLS